VESRQRLSSVQARLLEKVVGGRTRAEGGARLPHMCCVC